MRTWLKDMGGFIDQHCAHLPQEALAFIKRVLVVKPGSRPSAAQLLQDPYLAVQE